jgi:GIGANTEA protein
MVEYIQLLEVTARAIHLIVEWGDPGVAVADGLSNLLKVCHLLVTHISSPET